MISSAARSLLDRMFAAQEACPDERRAFCIPSYQGSERVVIHKGFAGGSEKISAGLLDEMVMAGFLRKLEPADRTDCLYALTDAASAYRAGRKPWARIVAFARSSRAAIVGLIGLLAAIVTILAWANTHP